MAFKGRPSLPAVILGSETLQPLRVDDAGALVVTASVLSTTGSAIKITDGSQTTTITDVAGKKSLDVNVTDITLSQANDSVATRPLGFSTISGSSAVSVDSTSTQLLPANSNRVYAHISNNSSAPAFVQYGSQAVLGRGIKLQGGALLTVSGFDLYLGQINAISANPTTIDVLEGTI